MHSSVVNDDIYTINMKVFDEQQCTKKGGCIVISTFRQPASQMVSKYMFRKCSPAWVDNTSQCESLANFDQDTLVQDFLDYIQQNSHSMRLRNYYHDIASALSLIGYAAIDAWDNATYDMSKGFLSLELLHLDGGKPMRWLLLGYEHISEWEQIMSEYAPGFKLLNAHGGDHGTPPELYGALKSQESVLLSVLKNPLVWPEDLLRDVKSWDIKKFYTSPID